MIWNYGYPFSLFPRPFPGALSTEAHGASDGVICVASLTAVRVRRHQMAVCRAGDNYIFEQIFSVPRPSLEDDAFLDFWPLIVNLSEGNFQILKE